MRYDISSNFAFIVEFSNKRAYLHTFAKSIVRHGSKPRFHLLEFVFYDLLVRLASHFVYRIAPDAYDHYSYAGDDDTGQNFTHIGV